MVEKATYDVIKKIDNVEIRNYPKMMLASVKEYDGNEAFELLFNYISGYNTSRRKISMTAPVITSEKIPMTAPVLSQDNYMAFIMPSSYDESTIPKPRSQKVNLEIQQKRKIAAIRFGGRTSNKKTEKRISGLLLVLKNHKIKTKGEPFLMRYNSPFAPGFMRRNEVAIQII